MNSDVTKRNLEIIVWISLGVVSQIHRLEKWNVHEAIILFISFTILLIAVICQILAFKMESDRVKLLKSRK